MKIQTLYLWLSWLNEEVFHLAACEHIQKRRHLKGTFIAGLNPLSEKTVCLECLQLLKFDGLDARRISRRYYSRDVKISTIYTHLR